MRRFIAFLTLISALSCGGGAADVGTPDTPDVVAPDVPDAIDPDMPAEVEAPPVPLREQIAGSITERVRFVIDESLRDQVDAEALKQYVLAQRLREADDYSVPQKQKDWWDDYQDECEILYYSAEHTFGAKSPYPGERFCPAIWPDVTYRVADIAVDYADLSAFQAAGEARAIDRTDPAGTTWHLRSANDAFDWLKANYANAYPNEMVVVVSHDPALTDGKTSYYFHEEAYAKARGWDAWYYNLALNEWPASMQTAEGLTPHDLPIWMHEAFLNGEWNDASKRWELFPNGRWGGYEDTNVYVIEAALDTAIPFVPCEVMPRPASHSFLDETAWKQCASLTERLEYDWLRLWRHAFNVPSFPFWWSQKVDLRVVLVDLRDSADGQPEYDADDVIDWQTFEDTVRDANPYLHLTIQRQLYAPPADVKDVLLKYFVLPAAYPFHAEASLPKADGTRKTLHLDWHHHVDIAGLPGLQVYLAEKLAGYFGGMDGKKPVTYDPFAGPYAKTGKPFVMPALFFLTPFGSKNGQVGGWTANTGDLMCIFGKQLGLTCEQLHQMMITKFGQPVGPNLNAWSNAYGFWWEVFVVDWTYATSPIPTLRFILDPEPFQEVFAAIPDIGPMLNSVADKLFDQFFGRVHPWTSGFPVWFQETLSDPDARETTRQFTAYQFAETVQHNIGYKHQTTVIFDSPYLGMEQGFDYRKHHDVNETFDMTVEQATMPFYSTEPGSRDFPIDANSYLTHKMGAGTRHVLGRVFARREIGLLYDELTAADPSYATADPDYRAALGDYHEATTAALAWRDADAVHAAMAGLEHLDAYLTAHGQPDRLHTDWSAPVDPMPSGVPLSVDATQLEKDLKRLSGQ